MPDPIIIRCEQRSQPWHDIRLGLPTSSKYSKILTPAKLALSSQSWKYRNELLADWIAGYPTSEMEASDFMDRGTEMEPRARRYYEFERSVEVEEVGFVMTADHRTGCSPDGLTEWGGEPGGVEIKVPALHTHVGYLLEPQTLVDRYWLQVQGSLWITGRAWWDILSWNPTLPPIIKRVKPDPEVHEKLAEAIGQFCDDLDEKKQRLADWREQRPDGFVSPLPGERSALLERLEQSLDGPVEAMAADARRLAGRVT